jgi:hypothetical protein
LGKENELDRKMWDDDTALSWLYAGYSIKGRLCILW